MVYYYSIVNSMQEGKRRIPDTQRKENQVNVRLTDKEMEALQTISERNGMSVAYFVREGVKLVIKRYSRKP